MHLEVTVIVRGLIRCMQLSRDTQAHLVHSSSSYRDVDPSQPISDPLQRLSRANYAVFVFPCAIVSYQPALLRETESETTQSVWHALLQYATSRQP